MGEKKGLDFFRKLAQMKPQVRTGHTLLAELVAAGEIPLVATIYNHNAERLLVNGAPIKWKALDPTFGRPNAVAVAQRAPSGRMPRCCSSISCSRPRARSSSTERNRVPASTAVQTNLNKFPVPHDRPGGGARRAREVGEALVGTLPQRTGHTEGED